MKGIASLSAKVLPVLNALVGEIAKLSWGALVAMLAIGGILMLVGNEHGAKKLLKNALYGFSLIQLASMIL